MIDKTFIYGNQVYAFTDRKIMLNMIKNKKKILVAINAEKILKENLLLKQIINRNIGYPDGVGAVMALRQKGFQANRIPGVELWLDIIKEFHYEKTFYLLGSREEIIDITVDKLKKEYINIKIVGYQNGYLKEEDKEKLISELKNKKPDVVFVAQGSPQQEILMDELINEHSALYVGVGGSFDVYSGFKKRAPKLFVKYNLEWLYRLIREPARIGRQLILIKYVYLYILKKL